MSKEEILKIICETADTLQTNQNDFFSVAQLGAALSRNNFDYSTKGYKKLIDLLNDFKNEIEISTNEVPSKLPYAKIKNPSPLVIPEVGIQVAKRIKNLDFDSWGIFLTQTPNLAS